MRYLPKRSFPKRHQDIPFSSNELADNSLASVPLGSVAGQQTTTGTNGVRRHRTRVSVNMFSPMTTRAQLAVSVAAIKRKLSESGTSKGSVESSNNSNNNNNSDLGSTAAAQQEEDNGDDAVHCKKRQRRGRADGVVGVGIGGGLSAPPANMLEVSALFGMSTLH